MEPFKCEKKWAQSSLKCLQQNAFTNHIYLIYVYKEDVVLNNLQWLICHKTKQNQTKPNHTIICLGSIKFYVTRKYSLRVFHVSFNLWSLAEVWVTINLLRSPRLFELSSPISTVIRLYHITSFCQSRWSRFFLRSSVFPSHFSKPLSTVRSAPNTFGITVVTVLCSTAFFLLWQNPRILANFFGFSSLFYGLLER